LPTTVEIIFDETLTCLTTLFPRSEIYKFPTESVIVCQGKLRSAEVATPPSPFIENELPSTSDVPTALIWFNDPFDIDVTIDSPNSVT
jgi:hypothetical protein